MATDHAGAVAPDGSPVELYLLLPSFGEPEIVHGAIAAGASILELESAEMLAHVKGATTIQARIEDLDLESRFDCVLLASHFVNAADRDERRRVLEVCAGHLAPDGRVVIEAYPADWRPATGDVAGGGDLEIRYLRADWDGDTVTAEIEYRVGERRWTQGPFTAAVLDEAALVASLAEAGLAFDGWLDDRRSWLAARTAA
jgi:SAM-dependent methyltransferase